MLQLVAHNAWHSRYSTVKVALIQGKQRFYSLEVQECYELTSLNRLIIYVKRRNSLILMHFWQSIDHDKIEVQDHWVLGRRF